jgi:hypothetical protein
MDYGDNWQLRVISHLDSTGALEGFRIQNIAFNDGYVVWIRIFSRFARHT